MDEFEKPKCELCCLGWKKPNGYSTPISHIFHIIARHIDSEEALETAQRIAEATGCSSSFPFLDFQKSLQASRKKGSKVFCCSKCDSTLIDGSTFVRHSRRNHLNPLEKFKMGQGQVMGCPFGCREMIRKVRNGFTFLDSVVVHFIQQHGDLDYKILRDELKKFYKEGEEESALLIKKSLKMKEFCCGQCGHENSNGYGSATLAGLMQHFKKYHIYKEEEEETEAEYQARLVAEEELRLQTDERYRAKKEREAKKKEKEFEKRKKGSARLALKEAYKAKLEANNGKRKAKNRSPKDAPSEMGLGCKYCDFRGLTLVDVRLHFIRDHAELAQRFGGGSGVTVSRESRPSICAVCDKEFENRVALKKHVAESHSEEEMCFTCWYCDKTFRNFLRVREHERRQHETPFLVDRQDLKCLHCDMLFTTKHNFNEHLRRHRDLNSSMF